MHRRMTRIAVSATVTAVAGLLALTTEPAMASTPRTGGLVAAADAPLTVAVMGDTPYGDAQRAAFPRLVSRINADPGVGLVLHAGDVKSGASTCSNARFADLAGLFGTFSDPFVLTPGDNEWTDCHKAAAGRYVPTERLEAVRRTFFPVPGRTLGVSAMSVLSQASDPGHASYVENVMFERSRVVFASVHVVGSKN
ncbi:MAG: metallophosphoesterase, partial [Actinomycetes bacterium]